VAFGCVDLGGGWWRTELNSRSRDLIVKCVRFSIPLAFSPAGQWTRLARTAEDAGFHSVAVSDHVVYPGELRTPYPYTADGRPRWDEATPWPDPLVAVGALASATERLHLVTSIYILPLRHPVAAAKQVATAAIFAGGRLTLGIGAGWMREEFELLGQPFERRGRRLEEAVLVMRKLWAGGMVEHHGEFYDFAPIRMSPVPEAPIPIWGGGTSEPALRRAAWLLDGWISEMQTREEIRAFASKLRRWRSDSPLAGQPFGIRAAVTDAFTPDHYREMEAVGVTELVAVPWLSYRVVGDDLEKKCDAIRRFGDEVVAKLV
jgi:probable F420-dependent oxidoreductase